MGFFTKKKAMDRDSIDTMLMRHDVKGLINALKHEDKRIVGWAAMALADAYHVWEWVKADEDNAELSTCPTPHRTVTTTVFANDHRPTRDIATNGT